LFVGQASPIVAPLYVATLLAVSYDFILHFENIYENTLKRGFLSAAGWSFKSIVSAFL
jgi:hypothetical protein